MRHFSVSLLSAAVAAAFCLTAAAARAQPAQADAPTRETRWTGPLVTAAPPSSEGVFNIEPYLIFTDITGAYDKQGHRRGARGAHDDWRLAVPMTYGVTDRLTIGATLRTVYARTANADRRVSAGDTTVMAQYSLFRSSAPSRSALAVGLRQNIPTGRHDQLDRHGLADATGSGAAFTTLGLYGQTYLLPERNLRTRFNLYYRIGGAGVNVDGRSGYGTSGDYRGRVHLGEAWQANLGAEYSFSPRWVVAADLVYEREQGARLDSVSVGHAGVSRSSVRRDGSWRVSVAPAVEYHWSRHAGLIVGAQVSLDGRNSSEFFSPQVAFNYGF